MIDCYDITLYRHRRRRLEIAKEQGMTTTTGDEWNGLSAAWDAWQAEGAPNPRTTEAGRRYLALFDAWVDAAQIPANMRADR